MIPLSALLVTLLTAIHPTQSLCGVRAEIVQSLENKYGEFRVAGGMSGSFIVEIFASETEPYTWSILYTAPNGVTCVKGAGENYLAVIPGWDA